MISSRKRKADEVALEGAGKATKRFKFSVSVEFLLNMIPEVVAEMFSWLSLSDLMMARVAFYSHPTLKDAIEKEYHSRNKEEDEDFWAILTDAECQTREVNTYEYVYLRGVRTNNVELMREVYRHLDAEETNVFQMYMVAICYGHLEAFYQVNEHFGTHCIRFSGNEEALWGALSTSRIGVECFDLLWKQNCLYVHRDYLDNWICLNSIGAIYRYRYNCLIDYLRNRRILELLLCHEDPESCLYQDRDLLPHLQQYPVPPLPEPS